MKLKTALLSATVLAACMFGSASAAQLVVGFSQIGSESGWRAAETTVTKQEAEKVWEPKSIAEIASGKDPRRTPQRESTAGKPATVADLLTMYRQRYVDVERLKKPAHGLESVADSNGRTGSVADSSPRTPGSDRGLQGPLLRSSDCDNKRVLGSAPSYL